MENQLLDSHESNNRSQPGRSVATKNDKARRETYVSGCRLN